MVQKENKQPFRQKAQGISLGYEDYTRGSSWQETLTKRERSQNRFGHSAFGKGSLKSQPQETELFWRDLTNLPSINEEGKIQRGQRTFLK